MHMLFGEEHIRRYEETDGKVGFDWGDHGAKILILTTIGRKTGQERKNALIFEETPDGGYAIVSSNGGAPAHPSWHHNLVANPEVQVQIKGDKFKARARVTHDEERAALWPKLAAVWPDYNEYVKRTDRQIPIVVLERI
jgi:deazaflavin-dependent oxidoreductase (nitroreductase family)